MSGSIILPKSAVKEANRASKDEKCKKMMDYWSYEKNTVALKGSRNTVEIFKSKIEALKNLYLKYKAMDNSQEVFGYCDIVSTVVDSSTPSQIVNVFNDNLINFGITLASHLNFAKSYKEKHVWTSQLDSVYKIQYQAKVQQLQMQFTDICERLFDCILICVGVTSSNDNIRTAALNEFFPESINDPVELLDIHIKMIDAILAVETN